MMGIICFNPLYYLSILGKSYSNWIFSKPKNGPTSPLVESLSINFVCHHDPIHDGVFVGAALLLLMCTAAAMYYKAMLSFAWYTRTLCSLSQNSNKLFTYIYVCYTYTYSRLDAHSGLNSLEIPMILFGFLPTCHHATVKRKGSIRPFL